MVRKARVLSLGLWFLALLILLPTIQAAWAKEIQEIRIGAINAMTGVDAMIGVEQKWAYEQAVADINQKGGIYVKELGKRLPVKLIFADDKSMPDQAAAAMEKLIKMDEIDLAISSDNTPKNLAAATVAEKYKVFFLINIAWPMMVEELKYKYVANFFFTPMGAARVPFQIWNSLPEADRIKRPGLITEDNMDGQAFHNEFIQGAKEYGYTFAMDQPSPIGNKDFSSHVLKLKAAKADALLFHGPPTDGIILLRQIREARLNLRYIHGWKGFWPTEFLKGMGQDADYIIHDGFWSENSGAPGAKTLGQRYMDKFGKDSVSIGLHYATPQILAMAIEKAGSFKSDKVRDAVFGGEFKDTMMGDIQFNQNGIAETSCLGLQWWKGERMPVYPPIKEWTVKLIPKQ
jgi:branched-chain amino acid transport system substrate-binding protein